MSGEGFVSAPADDADWDLLSAPGAPVEATLHLDLDGWEGPLDLLLDLARRHFGRWTAQKHAAFYLNR